MARKTKRRQPYNPAAHDRRTSDLNRGIGQHVAPIEVDDPMEIGGKLIVMRSTRNDPLAGLHARRHIDEAQYHGGRAFQHDFETAERGPKAIDPSKEYVDGGTTPEPITEAQRKAAYRLKRVFGELGLDGSALVHDVLIHGMNYRQISEARGLSGERWERMFGARFQEHLHQLAGIYGFATNKTGKTRVGESAEVRP